MAEEERVKKARNWAADYDVARKRMEAIARQRFWVDRGVPSELAEKLAAELLLTPEQLSRESERFDPNLATEKLRMIDVARRLFTERGLPFPVS
jgi:magnesium-transporting ATPase (P-type)